MIAESTGRYEQRITNLSKQLIKTLRRASQRVGRLRTANDAPQHEHHRARRRRRDVRFPTKGKPKWIDKNTSYRQQQPRRIHPLKTILPIATGAPQSSIGSTSASSQSSSSQTSMSTTQDPQQPQGVVVWATIRHLAIYRHNGALYNTNASR